MFNFHPLAMLRPPVVAGVLIAAATTGAVLAAKPAMALTIDPILTLNGNQITNSGDGPWNLGFSFTTASTQTFNALGVADFGTVGLSESHGIGLYDTSGNLLASALGVTGTGSVVQDGFVWAAISPITLGPGTYIVGASGQWNGDAYGADGGITVDSGFTYNGPQFVRSLPLQFPSIAAGVNPGYFGANISKAAVPGPLPALGIAAAFGCSRRLRQRLRASRGLEV